MVDSSLRRSRSADEKGIGRGSISITSKGRGEGWMRMARAKSSWS